MSNLIYPHSPLWVDLEDDEPDYAWDRGDTEILIPLRFEDAPTLTGALAELEDEDEADWRDADEGGR